MTRFPDFYVIGAQKSGTTSLHNWLIQHKDVSLPTSKETAFFSRPERYAHGLDWYFNQYEQRTGDYLMGEVDPSYMYIEAAAQRLRDHVSRTKFVCIFRNPLERAYSQYLMSVSRGVEDLSFVEALYAEAERTAPELRSENHHFAYMQISKYTEQIERFQTLFPDSDYLFIKFDDLVSNGMGDQTYQKICSFLGIADWREADRSESHNKASKARFPLVSRIIYNRHNYPYLRRLTGLIPADFKLTISQMIDNLNKKPIVKDNMIKLYQEQALPEPIMETALAEISRLQAKTQLNLDNWLQDPLGKLNPNKYQKS